MSCPSSEHLARAAAGELDDRAAAIVADHLIGCARCAEDYRVARALAPWAAEAVRTWPDDSASGPAAARWRRLTPLYALAASLLLVSIALAVWALSLRSELTTITARGTAAVDAVVRERDGALVRVQEQASRIAALEQATAANEAAELNVPIADLGPDTLRGSATPVPEIAIPASARTITLVLSSDAERAFADYALELTASGKTVWSATGIRRTAANTFTLALPVRLLGPGVYQLRLYGVSNGRREALDAYTMRVRVP